MESSIERSLQWQGEANTQFPRVRSGLLLVGTRNSGPWWLGRVWRVRSRGEANSFIPGRT